MRAGPARVNVPGPRGTTCPTCECALRTKRTSASRRHRASRIVLSEKARCVTAPNASGFSWRTTRLARHEGAGKAYLTVTPGRESVMPMLPASDVMASW